MNSNTSNNIDGYEFAENQKNLWQIGKSNSEVFYNQVVLKFDQQVTCDQMQHALTSIVQQHEVLTFKTYVPKNYIFPVQCPSQEKGIDYVEVDSSDEKSHKLLLEQLDKPYSSSQNLPIRFCVLKENNYVKKVYIRVYALWADTYSMLLLCKEVTNAIKNRTSTEEDGIAYVNYAAWQNELVENPEEDAVVFWDTYKPNVGQQIDPFFTASKEKFNPQRKQIVTLKGKAYDDVKNNCNNANISIEDALLHQYVSYLSIFTDEEITIGYMQPKRAYEELNGTLGLITKTLPVKCEISNDATLLSRVEDVKKSVEQVENWADYFSLNRKNTTTSKNHKIFNYGFEYLDCKEYSEQNKKENGFVINDFYTVNDAFQLKINCIDYGDSLTIEIYYDAEKYTENDINVLECQLRKYITNIHLDTAVKTTLSQIESAIIATTNDTKRDYSKKQSVLDLFRNQVENNPDDVALIYKEKEITYRKLNEFSDQFATHLSKEFDIVSGEAICILLERSEWCIISILGVLKTGAYYIPIDQSYPEERIKFILQDSNCKLLISDIELLETVDTTSLSIVNPSESSIYKNEPVIYQEQVASKDVAYCIYTSGSTGNPKGCLVTHRNLMHYIEWANEYYFDDTTQGNWALLTSISFDLTVTSIFTSLTRGKKLTIKSEEKEISELLEESFNDPSIDTLKLTPAHLSLLKELDITSTHVSTIICGGEQLLKSQVDIVRNMNPDVRIFNEYGPTETTVGCIVKEVFDEEKIVIGRPTANTTISIKNTTMELCQIGEIGEIIISGSGVSEGYFNRPELTTERFIETFSGDGKKSYKTGDLGRWLPDGNIEYIGRKDDQVKIRGYRIELGSIEQHLRDKEDVIDAVVIATSIANEPKELIAYVVSDEIQSATSLQTHLVQTLPEYMLPSHYVQLKKIPLTANGKIDRKTLLEIDVHLSSGVAYVAPANEVEEKLVVIWEEIVRKDEIGTHDNFFVIGGNSLKAVTVINHIYKTFDVKLQLRDFFKSATVIDIAKEINTILDIRGIQKENSNQEFDSEIVI